ncbi:MAG: tRNA(Glu)-specific nuclease WapA [Luteibacter sp.]|nr:MAG: tRNA(Glu)-specific nuclease WapA [Luteibacter sp.]
MDIQRRASFLSAYLLALVATQPALATEEVTYYYTDPQGNVLATTDANGNLRSKAEYTPFGREAMDSRANQAGFVGHVTDAESDYVYMQARYYDPSMGRFLSPDPLDLAAGRGFTFNRFTYAANSPATLADYTGLYAEGMSGEQINCEIYRCENIGPGDGERFTQGLRASKLADKALISAGVLGSSYGSAGALSIAWSDVVQPITNRLKVEIGADILFRNGTGYSSSNSYSTGDRNTIDILMLRNVLDPDRKQGEIHTHPDNNSFSGRTAVALPLQSAAVRSGDYGHGDLVRYFNNGINGYVSLPNGTIYGWDYRSFKSDVDRHGQRQLGDGITTIRGEAR